ncbi:MAG: cation transporter [Clostridiaceae bacterium]|nr:cation transporter [Clostridiaceae bacterium]
MDKEKRFQIGNRISKITILANVFLTLIKAVIGIIAHSSAMIADSIHTLSDVATTIAVMIGLRMSKKDEDADHPYGHEKIEPIVSSILASILFITALAIGYAGIKAILSKQISTPEPLAIYGAILSIAVKEWMYRYTVKGAKAIESTALLADAWHHRSDAFSSIGALLGITGAIMGYPILDPLAALIISILIAKVSIDIYSQAIRQLIDYAGDAEMIESIRQDILKTEGVIQIDNLKTRVHANKMYVDVELSVDSNMSLTDAHAIAEHVHNIIETNQKNVKHCMVHVNPLGSHESE